MIPRLLLIKTLYCRIGLILLWCKEAWEEAGRRRRS